jgi:hypothetical protein
MRKLRALTAVLALVAAAACGDGATAPTDADLVGTWTIAPAPALLPGGGLQGMTVHFGTDGAYTLQTTTWGATSPGVVQFGTQTGSVRATGGELRFHPSSAVSVGRLRATGNGFDMAGWDASQAVGYQVVGNRLVLHLPSATAPAPVLVLTRSTP